MFGWIPGNNKQAARVDKSYYGHHQETYYIIDQDEKIQKLFSDMRTNPTFFQEQTKIDDELDDTPDLAVVEGSFGFVPGKNIPIVTHIRYVIDALPEKKTWGFWHALRLLLWVTFAAIILFGIVGFYVANEFGRAAELMYEQRDECIVTTKGGEPVSIRMYGETLFYDKRGEIVIPDIRDIRADERRAYQQPFTQCKVVAIDGVAPGDMRIRRF